MAAPFGYPGGVPYHPGAHVVRIAAHPGQPPARVVQFAVPVPYDPTPQQAYTPGGLQVPVFEAQRERAQTRGVNKENLIPKHQDASHLSRHYETIRELGAGAFGKVTLVKDELTGQERVCKVVNIKGATRQVIDFMKDEIKVMCTLDHPHVVKLYEYAEDFALERIVMILEYIPGGACDGFMHSSSRPLSEGLIAKLTHQLLTALSYCHGRGVAHRDIKPENMMLTCKPQFLRSPDCKLIDFGLAGMPKTKGSALLEDCVGTAQYMAPEVITFMPYTSKADIWSVGITVAELLTGRQILGKDNLGEGIAHIKQEQIFQNIRQFTGPESLEAILQDAPGWTCCSEEGRDFVSWCLTVDVSQRPTVQACLNHPWLVKHKPEVHRLNTSVAQALAGFVNATPLARCCALILAARLGVRKMTEQQELGAMFLAADSDGDGKLSQEDLEAALSDVDRSWWDSEVNIDVEMLIDAGDMNHSGGLNYTEFMAAYIHARFKTLDDLLKQTFHALDADRDGLISVAEIRDSFRERDAPLLQMLPQGRPFNIQEWCDCAQKYGQPKLVVVRRNKTCC